MNRLWPIAVGAALLAPLVTWLPMLAHRFPVLGLPAYPPAPGIDLWQIQTLWLAAIVAIAALLHDHLAHVAGALTVFGLILFLRGVAMDPTHTVLLAVGLLLLAAMRWMPPRYVSTVRRCLIGMACFQALYAFQQWLGYDVLWGPLLGGVLADKPQMLGTLGSVNATAGYIALVVPLMPIGLAIPCAAMVLLSKSLGAALTLIVGVAMCWRETALMTTKRWIIAVGLTGGAVIAAIFVLKRATHGARLMIWQFAAQHWEPGYWLTGWGLGGWSQRVPELQQRYGFSPTGEIWREAHNEPLQWMLETGLIGAVLLGLWLWSHRAMFAHPVWGPSVTALAVHSLGWHPFHIVSTALLSIIVVGLAMRPKEEPTCAVA